MKYKLLLAGKNQVIIDDFFYIMHEEFECMTTSLRSSDIANHIRYFQPDAFVFCCTPDTRENVTKLITALGTVERKNLNLILVGDSDSCGDFIQIKPDLVSLTLLKPITASSIKQQIIKFLMEQKGLEQEAEKGIEEEPTPLQTAEKVEESAEESKHILIIDDDPIMLRLIKTELKDTYNVATAISGKIGLNFLKKKKTDLILLDYEMPEENGAVVLEKIRMSDELKDIPVIFLTGINDREKIKSVLAMKPQGYLLKPIEHDKLIETINQVLG